MSQKYGIVLKPKKRKFGTTEIEFVGRVINELCSTMHDKTVTKVFDFPLPIYFKQLRGFTGLVYYFAINNPTRNQNGLMRPHKPTSRCILHQWRKRLWNRSKRISTSWWQRTRNIIYYQVIDLHPIKIECTAKEAYALYYSITHLWSFAENLH